MKGLIIKDIMCLKKQIIYFAFAVVCVCVIGIMFVLSYKFGNLAKASAEMMTENKMDGFEIDNIANLALILCMILPLATIGEFSSIFEHDRKAGFAKVSGAMPVSIGKRLLARYLTIFTIFALGAVADLVIAFLLSRFTDLVSFREFLGIILSVASILAIYGSFLVMYSFILKTDTAAKTYAFLSVVVLYILVRFQKFREIFANIRLALSEKDTVMSTDRLWDFLDVLKNKPYIFLIAAALVAGITFAISYYVASTKREVI